MGYTHCSRTLNPVMMKIPMTTLLTRSFIRLHAMNGILMPIVIRGVMRSLLITIFLLPLFSHIVLAATTADAHLTWAAPITTDSGAPLTGLAGYRIYYGHTSQVYTDIIDTKSLATSYTITGLSNGQWYFAVTAYDVAGRESRKSMEVTKTIPAVRSPSLMLPAILILILIAAVIMLIRYFAYKRS